MQTYEALWAPQDQINALKYVKRCLPHGEFKRNPWGPNQFNDMLIRVYGFKPYCRFVIFDFTKFHGTTRLVLFGVKIFHQKKHAQHDNSRKSL